MQWVDLHTHSTASDGTDSPEQVVCKAARLGLAAVALTDHDTITGLDEAEAAGHKTGVEVVRGCEVSASSPFGEVHILGLWLPPLDAAGRDPRSALMREAFAELHGQRTERNLKVLANLQDMGIRITYEEVCAEAHGPSIGRPHIAAVLVKRGVATSVADAFHRLLRRGAPAFSPRRLWDMEEAVSFLAGLEATVCLAHPGLIPNCPPDELEQMLATLKEYGLNGIEAYHSEHSPATTRLCVELADKLGLVCSGGSDYHGDAKPHVHLGTGKGGLRVSRNVLDALKAERKARGLAVQAPLTCA